MGDCNWNPQPICCPLFLIKSIIKPIARKVINVPAEKIKPCFLTSEGFSEISRKFKIFKEMTGKTHGIRFKIKPPKKAKIIAKKGDKSKRLDFFGNAVSNR